MPKLKKVAITIGDPGGIGPEVALKAVISDQIAGVCRPLLIGDRAVLQEAVDQMNIPVDLEMIEVLNMREINSRDFDKCRATVKGGRASVSYVKKAADLALLNIVDAIVTAPISKESLKMARFPWTGHTDMLAELTETKDYSMMLCGGPLRVILTTIHAALVDVPGMITKERVLETILLAQEACAMMGINEPRIAVAGLNPHSGEKGIFGTEELSEIIPAVGSAQASGVPVSGPYPADSLFRRAYVGEFDIVVCMYHDQGLIPLKMIAFDEGVNVTVGLPIIRTSPDHGTAYDKAWKGIANPSSMIEAIKMAVQLEKPHAI